MKLIIGMPPPVECDLVGARRLIANYPRVHGIALVLGVCVVAPVAYVLWWGAFGPTELFGVMDRSPLVFIGLSVMTILVHEFLHLTAMPGMGFKGNTVAGFDPKSFLAYVAYLGVASKRRMLLVLGMPLLALTGVPFLVVLFHPGWNGRAHGCPCSTPHSLRAISTCSSW